MKHTERQVRKEPWVEGREWDSAEEAMEKDVMGWSSQQCLE